MVLGYYYNNQGFCFCYWYEIYIVECGWVVIIKVVDFLLNFSFVYCLIVFFVYLNCFYKYGNRFGEVFELKLKKINGFLWVFRQCDL